MGVRVSYRRLAIAILMITLSAKAQDVIRVDTVMPPVHLKHYGSDEGMLQNTVKQLYLDNQQFLWVISEKGLSRFDGTYFKHFPHDFFNGNYDHYRIDRILILNDSAYVQGDPQLKLRNGKLEESRGAVFDGPVEEIGQRLLLHKSNYRYLVKDEDLGVYLIGGPFEQKLILINDSTIYRLDTAGAVHYIVNGEVQATFEASDQRGTEDVRALAFRFFKIGQSLYFLGDGYIQEFANGKLKNHWKFDRPPANLHYVGTNQGPAYFSSGLALYKFDRDDLKLQKLLKLPTNKPSTVIEHPDGQTIFVGTRRDGFYIARTKRFKTLYRKAEAKLEGYRNVFEVGKDSILTATGILHTPSKSVDFSDQFLSVQVKGREDNWNFLRNKHAFITENGGRDLSVPYHLIWGSFAVDKNGQTWATSGRGIWKVGSDSSYIPMNSLPRKSGLRRTYYDPYRNSLWRVGYGRVHVYDIEEDKDSLFSKFNDMVFRHVHFADSLTWFCAIGKGLYAWDGARMIRFPFDELEAMRSCHCIVEDDKGFFWISTDNGLFKVSRNDLVRHFKDGTSKVHFYRFDRSEGFLINEFNGGGVPCGLRLKSTGKIAFPSMNGVVLFDPNEVHANEYASELFIEELKIDGRDTSLELSTFGQNYERLDFKISMAYYGDPQNMPMEYTLDGLHEKWYPLPANREIAFGRLPHGSYELKIRRHNGPGVDNFADVSYPFRVEKRYYQMNSFRVALILLFGLTLALFLRIWGKASRERQARLEKVIQEKTQDLLVLNEELKLNLAKVRQSEEDQRQVTKLKDRFMAMYTHDVRGPLRFIRMISQKSLARLGQIDEDDMRQRLEDISHSTNNVYLLTERMFHWLRTQGDDFNLRTEKIVPFDTVKASFDLFADQAQAKGVKLINEVDPDVMVKTERNVLGIVLNNLIDNAVKFTSDGSITVKAHQLEEHFVLTVVDTGIGIPRAKLEKIRSGIYQSTDGTAGEKGMGFGLRAIHELLVKINAYMQIDSVEGEGVSISVFLKSKQ